MAYLDYNATAPARPEVAAAVAGALSVGGNASSVHANGRRARKLIEDAREVLAEKLMADVSGIVFTSGGSEANALALKGLGASVVVASRIEHPSVLKCADRLFAVDESGVADLDDLRRVLSDLDRGAPIVVALMLANNETGAIQPVAAAASIARDYGALVHCDAVQGLGKIEFEVESLCADSIALSAHKIGGPQGVGALVLADGERVVAPLVPGGGQERLRRAGTENLPGIAGFGAALRVAGPDARIAGLRDAMEQRLRDEIADLVIFSDKTGRLLNTSCLAVPGIAADRAVMALDLDGVMVSAGSACSSGKVEPSHVLEAMGAGALAGSAVRVSLGWASSERDIERFIEAYVRLARSRPACRAA